MNINAHFGSFSNHDHQVLQLLLSSEQMGTKPGISIDTWSQTSLNEEKREDT